MGSSCGLSAFVVTESWSRYSSDSWPHPYPHLPSPSPYGPPPGQASPGRDNAQHSHTVLCDHGWPLVFKTFLDMGQTGLRGTWPTRNVLGHNTAKQGLRVRQWGNVCGVRKSQITLALESCVIQLQCTLQHRSHCGVKCSFCLVSL